MSDTREELLARVNARIDALMDVKEDRRPISLDLLRDPCRHRPRTEGDASMTDDYYRRCHDDVVRYAKILWRRAALREINANGIEALLQSYLEQPAFPPEWRSVLLDAAMNEGRA